MPSFDRMEPTTGILLAGGRSRRMGQPKGLLNLGGRTMIERVADALQQVAQEVIIVTNDPEEYRFLGLPLLGDQVKGRGPLGGIQAGLAAASWERTLVLACDLPFVEAGLLRFLLTAGKGRAAAVPMVRGFPEPLVAMYSRACLTAVEQTLASESCRVSDFYARIDVRFISEAELEAVTDPRKAFLNVNTPRDWEKALALAEEQ